MMRNIPPRRVSQVAVLRRAARTSKAQDGTTLLLLLCVLLFALMIVRPSVARGATLECGRDIRFELRLLELPAQGLQLRETPQYKAGATDIVLNAGPGLSARPQALAAWNQAVAIWEDLLDDPITVEIDGDFAALPAGVLGSTSPTAFSAGYTTIRNAMVNDAEAGESAASSLPTAAQKSLDLPPGFSDSGSVVGTKANLKALGFDLSFNTDPDASMVFSTGFESQFDYDPSDGISVGRYDFVAIVVHEIGHALGFTSAVDLVDYYRSNNQTAAISPRTLDLFRILPGTSGSFTTTDRCVNTGDLEAAQSFFDGSVELAMSTGVELGDGRQASHWKADELSGQFIGIMDPTLAPGQHEEISEADLMAFGLIGWDVLPLNGSTPAPPALANALQLWAHPNPFNPRTTIHFELPSAAAMQIDVYDRAGRHVRTLLAATLPQGEHELLFDGRDEDGRRLASGVYFLRARGGGRLAHGKLVLVQ